MKLAIVVPAHNEASNIPILFERLQELLSPWPGDWHVLFVDDGSDDDTLTVLEKMSRQSPRVRYLSLSRNFGQQAAITAGLDHADGDAILMMDADLQHPPEVIPAMLEKWKAGAEIVHAIRMDSPDSTWLKTWTSRLFYRAFHWLSESRLTAGSADFRLMDRCVVDALGQMTERARFLRGMIGWLGFRTECVEYIAPPRLHGHTSYTLGKMLVFAWTAIRSFSVRPLRLATWMGTMAAALGMMDLVYALYIRLFTNRALPGWTSLLCPILILGGFQLLCTGILGEYIAMVFEESKRRPIYIIRATGNIPAALTVGASNPHTHRPDLKI